jgi:hypothetical protein
MMMTFLNILGSFTRQAVSRPSLAQLVRTTTDPLLDTARLAQGARGRGIDPSAVGSRLDSLSDVADTAQSFLSHGKLGIDDALGVIEPNMALQLAPHAAQQISIIRDVGGLSNYADLVRTTTPNPITALREWRDASTSIFAQRAT